MKRSEENGFIAHNVLPSNPRIFTIGAPAVMLTLVLSLLSQFQDLHIPVAIQDATMLLIMIITLILYYAKRVDINTAAAVFVYTVVIGQNAVLIHTMLVGSQDGYLSILFFTFITDVFFLLYAGFLLAGRQMHIAGIVLSLILFIGGRNTGSPDTTYLAYLLPLIILPFLALFAFFRVSFEQLLRKLLRARRRASKKNRLLRQAQEYLIAQEKLSALGKLTAGIAHEINNPMRFITNYAELNREALIEIYDHIETTISAHHIELGEVYQELKASTLRTLEVINEQGSRVSGIIASMLALSREGSGEKSFVDLISLIRLSAKILGEELESAITQSLPEDPVMISLAWDEMSQVFSNIFQNAAYAVEKKMELSDRRYTPEIAVSIHQTSEQVRVEIRDNGIGIKADDAPKIGTPFFTTKEVGEGTGLGISIAREIVEKIHAGHLSISGTEGQGATVVITLPKDGR